jgi:hypothetical protein
VVSAEGFSEMGRQLEGNCGDSAEGSAGRELRRLDSTAVRELMLAFEAAFEDALRSFPPGPSSGLVEQQDWFKGFRT